MYFDNCRDLNELKSAYKTLVMENHPDIGGDTLTMQEINAEHDRVFEVLKRRQNEEAKNEEAKATTETPEEFREIVSKLIVIDGLDIELCGSWLWIGGNTMAHKDELKALGCRWSRNKGMWHWHHNEDGARWSRGRSTMGDIRAKYGSERLTYTDRRELVA